jgi:hypothetical protein
MTIPFCTPMITISGEKKNIVELVITFYQFGTDGVLILIFTVFPKIALQYLEENGCNILGEGEGNILGREFQHIENWGFDIN